MRAFTRHQTKFIVHQAHCTHRPKLNIYNDNNESGLSVYALSFRLSTHVKNVVRFRNEIKHMKNSKKKYTTTEKDDEEEAERLSVFNKDTA